MAILARRYACQWFDAHHIIAVPSTFTWCKSIKKRTFSGEKCPNFIWSMGYTIRYACHISFWRAQCSTNNYFTQYTLLMLMLCHVPHTRWLLVCVFFVNLFLFSWDLFFESSMETTIILYFVHVLLCLAFVFAFFLSFSRHLSNCICWVNWIEWDWVLCVCFALIMKNIEQLLYSARLQLASHNNPYIHPFIQPGTHYCVPPGQPCKMVMVCNEWLNSIVPAHCAAHFKFKSI